MTTDDGYRRGRQVVSTLHVHLVFVTKYQRGVFNSELGPSLLGWGDPAVKAAVNIASITVLVAARAAVPQPLA